MATEQRTHIQMKDPSTATQVEYVESAEIERKDGNRLLAFMKGCLGPTQYAWTRVERAHAGDEIWINMTTDGGRSWQEYGHFTITDPNQRNYTFALKTDASNQVQMQGWLRIGKDKYNTRAW